MLKNLVTLVTGAASGLGQATAERLARKGCRVILSDLKTSNGEAIAKTIGENSMFVPADVSIKNDVKQLIDATKEKFGRLDVVVNCAGISIAYELYNFTAKRGHSVEDFQRVLKTNTIGAYTVNYYAADLIAANKPDEFGYRGVIVNTAGIAGSSGQTAFSAACAGIVGMTKPLSLKLHSKGIRIVTVSPGAFDTPLMSSIPDRVKEVICDECITFPNRYGEPEEYAHFVQGIIANPFINGTTIKLDGVLNLSL